MLRRAQSFTFALFLLGSLALSSPSGGQPSTSQPVIIDTDIGDDIDDAFAIGLALQSPELHILGITTAWGDTELRADLVRRILDETGHPEIKVYPGASTPNPYNTFTQANWAQHAKPRNSARENAVEYLHSAIEAHPGQLTLIALGPLRNLGDLIDHYPKTFLKIKKIVMMGGSIDKGYGDFSYLQPHGADAEYNIKLDPSSARKVFTSSVPIVLLPLDSTQAKIEEVRRDALFSYGSPLTNALTLLYHQWAWGTHQATPTAFDVVAVATTARPELCPITPMHLDVTVDGFTRRGPGSPNVSACLNLEESRFLDFMMKRLMSDIAHKSRRISLFRPSPLTKEPPRGTTHNSK